MKPEFKEGQKGLVRGYFIYCTRYAGHISKEIAEDPDNTDVGIAYTFWHRHDDDPNIVESELERIANSYMAMHECAGGMYGYEYRPYKK